MNLVEELQSLDANDVGRWPMPFRVAVIAIVFLLVTGLGIYWFIVKDKAPQLERAQAKEQELRTTFENKQRKAANYDAYKQQLSQIEQALRALPAVNEQRVAEVKQRLERGDYKVDPQKIADKLLHMEGEFERISPLDRSVLK